MLHSTLALSLLIVLALRASGEDDRVVLVIHGGAGVRPKDKMTPELEKQYRADLEQALKAGRQALERAKGTSLDGVEAAIKVLEDSPRFNAGKGAVFTHEGRNELDASIMAGKTQMAGAVAGVTILKNPISAARAVMEKSPHVMLIGRGAELFATEHGIEAVDPAYFWTLERWNALKEALEEEKKSKKGSWKPPYDRYFGTVGAVALDRQGNLAAGTSTGGMTNKRFGRVGDTPLIGAGTYADNATCGVSCTGHGEIFIRFAVAKDVAARMKYKKLDVVKAAAEALKELPEEEDGVGGLIALDAKGNVAMPYNTRGMYRGTITRAGQIKVWIYDK